MEQRQTDTLLYTCITRNKDEPRVTETEAVALGTTERGGQGQVLYLLCLENIIESECVCVPPGVVMTGCCVNYIIIFLMD